MPRSLLWGSLLLYQCLYLNGNASECEGSAPVRVSGQFQRFFGVAMFLPPDTLRGTLP